QSGDSIAAHGITGGIVSVAERALCVAEVPHLVDPLVRVVDYIPVDFKAPPLPRPVGLHQRILRMFARGMECKRNAFALAHERAIDEELRSGSHIVGTGVPVGRGLRRRSSLWKGGNWAGAAGGRRPVGVGTPR